jgi:hypothetical protein
MSVVQAGCGYTVTNDSRWLAQYHDGLMVIYVSPDADICDAIATLVPPHRRHMWIVEPYDDDPDGWEVWVLSRE